MSESNEYPHNVQNEDNDHIGSSFDDFLKEEGIYDECKDSVIKRINGGTHE